MNIIHNLHNHNGMLQKNLQYAFIFNNQKNLKLTLNSGTAVHY